MPTGGGDNGILRGIFHDPDDCRRCFKGSQRQSVGDKQGSVAGTGIGRVFARYSKPTLGSVAGLDHNWLS